MSRVWTALAAASSGPILGAYGLRLEGAELDSARDLLVPAEAQWPKLELARAVGGPFERELDRVSGSGAKLHLENGGLIEIDLADNRATVTTPERIATTELVHPYLAPIAATLAYWLGRESFHAGAFCSDGAVWAIFGDRGAGKSSTLGWLALNGVPVVCDDMLILDGLRAFAGPRSVDLRKEGAEMLGAGEPLGVVGARERWRLSVPQVQGDLRLRGTVFLSWGHEATSTRLRPAERLIRLSRQRGVRIPPRDPEALIAIAELPSWEIARGPGRESLAATGERLVELTAAA
jgi:hypothetical protein